MLEFPRNLRYSPVNYLIVNWGFNGNAFNDCGLPEPQPCGETTEGSSASTDCCPLPIQESIETMNWETWLPEVIVGIDEPEEEIAASYVREAAIEFAKYTRVLQRQILIPLQKDVCVYPVEPYDDEQIIGVIGAGLDDEPACECSGDRCQGYTPDGVGFTLDVARNELHLEGARCGDCTSRCRVLRVLVWSAPTESACLHDVFLYERFRKDITVGARFNYATQVHFRDTRLIQSMAALPSFEILKAKAKNKAISRPTSTTRPMANPFFQSAPTRRTCF